LGEGKTRNPESHRNWDDVRPAWGDSTPSPRKGSPRRKKEKGKSYQEKPIIRLGRKEERPGYLDQLKFLHQNPKGGFCEEEDKKVRGKWNTGEKNSG